MNREDNHIDKLLAKWLTHTATPEEIEEIKDWAAQREERLEILETFQKAWKETTAEPVLVNAEEKINEIWSKGVEEKGSNISVWKPFMKYAAAIVLIAATSLALLYMVNGGFFQEPSEGQQRPYVVKENPAGQKTKLYLPDGSIVYLNSASSITYAQGFEGNERRVRLEGEAYFEVAKDKNKPFVVESGPVETTALGTAFNVNAYLGDRELRVSLLEGKVQINKLEEQDKAVTLVPGKEVVVDKNTQKLFQGTVDVDKVIGWKEGKLVFENAGFNEISTKLERWYGVDIQVKGQTPGDWTVTTIYQKQSLKNILIDLTYSKDFAYEINEETVTIIF
ncbi:DUF4974 domain-containing protein [Echinicola soli]|uniref:DUF4974 domain-containing protein n=1 Tax=Echinicola soli TaxID=2591634 RepID=A0A514CN49_9BACT|nr:FecR family protein [Echinicola soli]QDH81228.1 DUF4974 domain-containing protein [Echinicola soli]